jgi:tetratricopeptide (TPR) repeat protein
MSAELVRMPVVRLEPRGQSLPSAPPWRDLHKVPPAELTDYIRRLEQACVDNPQSADLRTCLGIAYAINYDVYRSMDALEAATTVDPQNFWAQFKYAELHYRLRTLQKAEEEAHKAIELAETAWQLALARRQLQEIRSLLRGSTRTVAWTKPLMTPVVVLSALMLVVFTAMMWK